MLCLQSCRRWSACPLLLQLPVSVCSLGNGSGCHQKMATDEQFTSDTTSSGRTSPMLEQLRSRIALRGGPLSIADYMKEVLTNPVAGYYMNKDVFGSAGDFVTSPEISQMFGEMIGIWMVASWMQMGSPPRVQLVELGPGRGTLMGDLLRGTAVFRDFTAALTVHLVEVSPTLRASQWRTLRCSPTSRPSASSSPSLVAQPRLHDGIASAGLQPLEPEVQATAETALDVPGQVGKAGMEDDRQGSSPAVGISGLNGCEVHWHRDVRNIPEQDCPILVVAHEFFDALPAHQFVKDPDRGWLEKMVDVDDEGGGLRMVLSPSATPAAAVLVPRRLRGLPEAVRDNVTALEVCSHGMAVAEQLALRIGKQGGAALLIDYGKDGPYENSLVAIHGHQGVKVLEQPGSADLSCWVDFSSLRQAAEDSGAAVTVHGPITQRKLLLSLGLQARLQQLLQEPSLSEDVAKRLHEGYTRLIDDSGDGMGLAYKALVIAHSSLQQSPVAFEEEPAAS